MSTLDISFEVAVEKKRGHYEVKSIVLPLRDFPIRLHLPSHRVVVDVTRQGLESHVSYG